MPNLTPIELGLALTLPAFAASADTFAHFESVCLAALESGGAPVVDGLEPGPSDSETITRWWIDQETHYSLLEFDEAPDVGARSCALLTSDEAAVAGFAVFLEAEVAAGRLRETEPGIWESAAGLRLDYSPDAGGNTVAIRAFDMGGAR